MTIYNPKEFNKYLKKGKSILNKLQEKVDEGIMYENFGQKELIQYDDKVKESDVLTYEEKYLLYQSLSESIDNISCKKGHPFF